jgi:hypothetical protein
MDLDSSDDLDISGDLDSSGDLSSRSIYKYDGFPSRGPKDYYISVRSALVSADLPCFRT